MDSGMILIDARVSRAFDHNTIRSAMNLPPNIDAQSITNIGTLGIEQLAKQKFREVVIFSDSPSWLEPLGACFVSEGKVSSVKFMRDGFTTFYFRYPFMCTSSSFDEDPKCMLNRSMRTYSGLHTVTFPNEIIDGFLYLGNASLDVSNVFTSDDVWENEIE